MEKRLIAKTQKILPKIPQYASLFSNIVTSTPEDEEILKRKGTVYGVFEVSGPVEFETSVISKTISDILQDSYFQSENISPVQSLEKAILDTKEKLSKLNENTLREKSTDLKLDIVAAVLWGNVLYIVQHGKGNAFIMREGETKPVSFLSEGNFSSASGIVKNDDVVVLSTTSFGEKYPPEVLLRTSNESFQELPAESSCLMIKFSIDSTFTSEEQIDFGLKKKKTNPIDIKGLKERLMQMRPSKEENSKGEGIISIRGKSPSRKPVKALILLCLIGLTISIVYTIKNRSKEEDVQVESAKAEVVETTPTISPTENDESFFYDLKLVDAESLPTDMIATENRIVVADRTTGKIYVSDIETPKFTAIDKQYLGIGDLTLKSNLVNFKDKDGYKTYNVEDETFEEYIQAEGLKITYPYLDFVYEINGDTISKYAQADSKTTWAQSADFSDAVSMVIDVSIYILSANGEMFKYTSGVKDTFALKDMDIALAAPTRLVMASESGLLYIADNGNKSIVEIDTGGNFKQRIYHQNQETWNDIKDITISPDESTLFVLNGTSVYEIEL